MPFVQSVLHATDFSPASNRAFAHALAIALLWQTELTILHVGSEKRSDLDWTRFPPVRGTLERWGLLHVGSPRSAVLEEFKVRVKKIAVRHGNPLRAIAAYVEEQPVDLVVLATGGDEQQWLDGAWAEAVERWAKTMALLVPTGVERDLVRLDDGDVKLNSILLPIDRRPDPAPAVEIARRAAEVLGEGQTAIRLLHVGDDRPPVPPLPAGPGWAWALEYRAGEAAAQILAAAVEHAADLIVMPTVGHNGVLGLLRGSTSEPVLRGAPCPILAVPG